MINNLNDFVLQNSPDGGFLQSEEWGKFQESVGRKTYLITSLASTDVETLSPHKEEDSIDFYASIIEHKLPLVGRYFYIPRGPIISKQKIKNREQYFNKLVSLAEENNAGWIRIEPATDEILEEIKKNIKYKIVKAPHDMQPKEILVMDIEKSEEQLLSEMKAKTRYNIRLAGKKGVKIIENRKYIDEFIRLTKIMAKRQEVTAHSEEYYQKMFEVMPSEIIKLYVAEYKNKIIAANIVVFYGNTCTYFHGASDDECRNIMAPFLLQWKQIQDAKNFDCEKYDFGGVKINNKKGKSWKGVTRFKAGFCPDCKPIEFLGSQDIIISPVKYWVYRIIQKIKSII